jgi:hypothetical protein
MNFDVSFQSGTARIKNAFVLLCICAGFIGCGSPNPESTPQPPPAAKVSGSSASTPAPALDPDDVPIKEADVAKPRDYAEALTRIEGYRNTIRDEIAAGRPSKAHRGLDELDIVLNWLPAIARDSGVPKENWEKVNTTAKSIQDLFNQVHSRIDDKKEPDYGSVSAAIDTAIGDLKKITAVAKTAEPEKKP